MRELVSEKLKMLVLDRDSWKCQVCGIDTPKSLKGTTNPQAPEVGHVVPVIAGGNPEAQNLRCECQCCNHFKMTLTDKELLAILMRRVGTEKIISKPIHNTRMSDALKAAKARGSRLGRPPIEVRPNTVRAVVDFGVPLKIAAKWLGISYGTAYVLNHNARRIPLCKKAAA